MTRTAVNVTGDCMVACIVGKSENELDIEVYNDPNAGIKSEEIDFEHFDKNS
jgi:Na+/H+-dicarboxylate symporter